MHEGIPGHMREPHGRVPQVRELEGQDMREAIQDRINAWFVEGRNPETGEYPDFPDADDGGSKVGSKFLVGVRSRSFCVMWDVLCGLLMGLPWMTLRGPT